MASAKATKTSAKSSAKKGVAKTSSTHTKAANPHIGILEVFPNPNPARPYVITHINEEFTSVCPKTGHPDFAKVTITYVPADVCVELKSLKLYFQSFRNKGIFYEAVTNEFLNDLVAVLNPIELRVVTEWGVRGGIRSVITAEYSADIVFDDEM